MGDENFDSANRAVLDKWTREEERKKSSAEHAERSIKKALANLLKQRENKVNIVKDLKNATNNRGKAIENEGHYGSDDELVTGFEERPWERD